jgi:hypothetical protein
MEIDVNVPRSVETDGSPCLDSGCGFLYPRDPHGSCLCPPDPKVQIWVDLDPNDEDGMELAGETTVHPRRDTTNWSEPILMQLRPISSVHMKVVDVDGSGSQPIFGCTIEDAIAVVASGLLECKQAFPEPGAPDAFEFWINARVEPTPADADTPD